jgi:hypothetical protein
VGKKKSVKLRRSGTEFARVAVFTLDSGRFQSSIAGWGAFCWLAYRSCGRRQVNFERRAYGAYTLDGNVAAVLLEDSVDHRQAQSSALSYALSGEKWLKDTRLHLWHHPGASAADD